MANALKVVRNGEKISNGERKKQTVYECIGEDMDQKREMRRNGNTRPNR